MKSDNKQKAKYRSVFRGLAIILSIIFIPIGVLALKEKLAADAIQFDSTFKFGIAALGWGIICLIVGIRGRLFKKDR